MADQPCADAEVESCLRTLGIDSLCQWDVLVFLYRHPTSLVGAEHIGHLLGYAASPVVAALDLLKYRGLVERSRVSRNVRLYQFTADSEPPRGKAFERLLALTSHPAGRLLLAERLRRGESLPRKDLKSTRQFLAPAHKREVGRQ
jgi:hypothetical protein